MEVELSLKALEDLSSIALYIMADSPVRALTFTDELEAKALSLRHAPNKGADRSDLLPGVRLLPHGNYNIYYRVLTQKVEVIRVFHSARHIDADDLS
jgi:toxin ParE1/3/4